MAAGLAALLDGIAAMANLAAAWLDDLGAAAGRASAKATGVVVDDQLNRPWTAGRPDGPDPHPSLARRRRHGGGLTCQLDRGVRPAGVAGDADRVTLPSSAGRHCEGPPPR